MVIYEPREDSFLLEKHVKKLALGSVLDMCTGSGIQAAAAAENKKVKKVLAVDINKEALNYARKNSAHKKIKYILSDLFAKVPQQKFDTIICNPPYLPQQAQIRDIATEGGKLGYEFIEKFLAEAGNYLKHNGNILLVFSSLTDKNMVHSLLEQYLFSYRFVDSVHYFFEEIYVYNIIKSKTAKELEKIGVDDIRYLARGKRGRVYTANYKGKKVAVKTKRKDSEAVGRIANEIKMLKMLNKYNIGPKLVTHDKTWLVYEFVYGEYIRDWLPKASKSQAKKVLSTVFEKCKTLDELCIDKEEMHHPSKHVIVGKKIEFIDFERAHKTDKPKNVSQFCHFIMSNKRLLEKKGFKIKMDKIIEQSRKYKQEMTEDNFKAILKEVGLN